MCVCLGEDIFDSDMIDLVGVGAEARLYPIEIVKL